MAIRTDCIFQYILHDNDRCTKTENSTRANEEDDWHTVGQALCSGAAKEEEIVFISSAATK
jgi:hypothetical protein